MLWNSCSIWYVENLFIQVENYIQELQITFFTCFFFHHHHHLFWKRLFLPRYAKVRRLPIWSPFTHPWILPIQDVNQAFSCPYPHILSKFSLSYISSLPPSSFYREIPSHPLLQFYDFCSFDKNVTVLSVVEIERWISRVEFHSSESSRSLWVALYDIRFNTQKWWKLPFIFVLLIKSKPNQIWRHNHNFQPNWTEFGFWFFSVIGWLLTLSVYW